LHVVNGAHHDRAAATHWWALGQYGHGGEGNSTTDPIHNFSRDNIASRLGIAVFTMVQ
jgi:hypothetical protein